MLFNTKQWRLDMEYVIPEGTDTFTIGQTPVFELAGKLLAGGMSRADAYDHAFDTILQKAGGHIVRVGEVFVPEIFDTTSPVVAMCSVIA
jgi:hypothetical protein